jgi:hypothetical protein
MEALEHHEKIESVAHGHSGGSPLNKRIALLIAILAALLAISEMAGKSTQTTALNANIDASNFWAFFQAKTIRMTAVRTAAESAQLTRNETTDPARAAALDKQIAEWRGAADRYDTEPSTNEGRRELAARAKAAEGRRDVALAGYHHFEYASAAFQLAIVLASATVVTGILWLAWTAIGLGVFGIALSTLGWVAPTLVHL